MEKTESDSDTRKMEKNGKTCSKTESDSDTEVKVSSLHIPTFEIYSSMVIRPS